MGPGSNAIAFADAANRARDSAPAEAPELKAAFDAWFLARLQVAGVMTGGAPTSQTMLRASGPSNLEWPKSAAQKATMMTMIDDD